MTPETAAALRAPFEAHQIGKLPRVTCRDCSDKNTNCTKHQKSKCPVCDAWISSAHIHLDYVGHAGTTDRLLQVDPEWAWEPVAFADDGAPLIRVASGNASLWIRLTIAGLTRLGVGIAAANAFELEKQLIGDAIRNAAMRFGVALDLWSKEDLLAPEGVDPATGEIAAGGEAVSEASGTDEDTARAATPAPPAALATKPQRAKIDHLVDTTGAIPQVWPLPDDFTKADASKLIDHLLTLPVEPPAERVSTLRTDADAAQQEFVS